MDAIITGESERIGLSIIDNNDVEHLIEMDKSGNIKYHEQDGYPDKPAKRTSEQKEYVSQARRFARYHVYRERGYQTLSPVENPDRIEVARQVLDSLSTESWESHFGDLHQQCASHFDDETDPAIEPPLDVGVDTTAFGGVKALLAANTPESLRKLVGLEGGKNLFYCQNIYLDVDRETVTDLLASRDLGSRIDPGTEPTDRTFWTDIGRLAAEQTDDLGSLFEIDAVGPLYGMVHGPDEETITDHDEPRDREPDARIQQMPAPSESLTAFRDVVDVHLRCQVRDCYLTMGCLAPDWTRITGTGLPKAIYRYGRTDRYRPYYDPDAKIDWERVPMSPHSE